MSQKRFRIARVVALTAIVAVGAAVMVALNTAAEPATDTALGAPAASPASAVQPGQSEDLFEPAAICRMAPECMTDSDCDYLCGEGLGKCGHSRCPVRVCRCRLN